MAKPAKTKKILMYLPVVKGTFYIETWMLYLTEDEAWNCRQDIVGVMAVEVFVEDK